MTHGNGRLRNGGDSCQGSPPSLSQAGLNATPSAHTLPLVRLITPTDTVMKSSIDDMEVSDAEEGSLPRPQAPSLGEDLSMVLTKKTKLRFFRSYSGQTIIGPSYTNAARTT